MKKIVLFFIIKFVIFCHPHIFIEAEFYTTFENNTLKNVNITLILDELNTTIYFPNNTNGDNIPKENIQLLPEIISHFNFYLNDKKLKNIEFEQADIQDNSLFLTLNCTIDKKIETGDNFIFSIYDSDFFYNYDYNKFSFSFNDESLIKNKSFYENKKKAYYFNMIFPFEYRLEF